MLSSYDAYLEIRRRLIDSGRGEPYAVVVHGAPGLGRSWLTDRVHAAARRARLATVTACGVTGPAAGDRPLSGHLLEQLRRLSAGARLDAGADLPSAVRQLLGHGPLVLVVDDLQAVDEATAHQLLELPRQIREPHLTLLLTNAGAALPPNRSSTFPQLELRPLAVGHTARLAESLLGKRASPQLVERLVRQSGGNPRLLSALVQDLQAEQSLLLGSTEYGRNFSQVLLDCVRRQPGTEPVAAAIAVLGEAPRELISAVSGQGQLLASLHLLVCSGVLDTNLQFRHSNAAEMLLDALQPEQRMRLHDRAAEALNRAGAPTERIADHLLAGSPQGAGWALEVLLDAAEQSLLEGRNQRRIALLRKASEYSVASSERRFDILAKLARAEWRMDPSSADRHITLLKQKLDPRGSDPLLVSGVIRQLFWHGEFAAAGEALRAFAQQPGEDQTRLVELRFIQQWLRFTLPAEERRLAPLLQAGQPGQDSQLLVGLSSRARAANLLDLLVSGRDSPATVVHQAEILAAEPVDEDDFEIRSAVIAALVRTDYHALAERWCEQVLADLKPRGALGWRTPFLAHLADLKLAAGELAESHRLAMQALDAITPRAWGIGVGQPLATALNAATGLGLHSKAAQLLGRPVPTAMMASRYGLFYLQARGRHYLATGRTMAALADFRTCGRMLAEWGRDRPRLMSWRLDAAEALAQAGQPDQARQLIADQLSLLGPAPSRIRAASLRALAALSTGTERAGVLAELNRLSQGGGESAEPAGGRAGGGSARSAASHPRRLNPSAKPVSAGHGHNLAGGDPALTCERGGLIARLSEAERRVALLAASGHSNRQIAEQLYITVSTVEQHLTRIYRKLGVRRRHALSGVLEPCESSGTGS